MNSAKYDAETTAQLSRSEALAHMFSTTGWKFAEEDLHDLIGELKDISTLDLDSGDVAQQIRDRKNLAEGLLEWVESLRSQVNNAIIMREDEDKKYIERR